MSKEKLIPAIVVAIVASVIAGGLLLIRSSSSYSSPEKSITAFIDAESQADLTAMEMPARKAFYQNFLGRFGEAKYREVRNIYQEAYDLAEPKWEQYREKARAAAVKEHQSIEEEISKLGHDAFSALPADKRLQLMDDRPRFNDFIFEEGLKALPANTRGKIVDPVAFRGNKDLNAFTDREGFALLPEEDQRALKTPAALSASLTPERIAFLESIGLPQLTEQKRQTIAGISSSDLKNSQEFMQRYGREPASEFLKNSALDKNVTMRKCDYIAEENTGSLFKGTYARCEFSINVRGVRRDVGAEMLRQGGVWQIYSLSPMLTAIPQAYPPRPIHRAPSTEPVATMPEPETPQEAVAPAETPVQRMRLPYDSWREVSDPATASVGWNSIMERLTALFAGHLEYLVTMLFGLLVIVLFCIVMTINFRRLRHERFLPEWLEGEIQLEEIEVTHWWSRVWLRLTNRRIVQVRLSWFLSRRKIFGIALDDIHSVTWRRYTNWILVLIAFYLFGRSNPIALLILMWGLESKILSIGFNTPLAQMPFPRARASATSFRRRQFTELATFYKKAQLHLAQVRSQKQLPVSRDVNFIPEQDKDFRWGIPVWVFVAMWLVIALGQRTIGTHVNLDGFWGGLLLGLPVAAAIQSLRSGVWSGVLGVCALVAVKFPGSIGLWLFDSKGDGGYPNLWQYVLLVAAAALIPLAAYGLSRINAIVAYAAPLLWLLPFALMRVSSLEEMRTYATCFIAIASAAAFSILAEAVAGNADQPVKGSESAGA
jgi:hypothetical protein